MIKPSRLQTGYIRAPIGIEMMCFDLDTPPPISRMIDSLSTTLLLLLLPTFQPTKAILPQTTGGERGCVYFVSPHMESLCFTFDDP